MSSVLQADSLLTEPPGKPANHINQVNIKLTAYLRISALGRTESQPLCKLIAATSLSYGFFFAASHNQLPCSPTCMDTCQWFHSVICYLLDSQCQFLTIFDSLNFSLLPILFLMYSHMGKPFPMSNKKNILKLYATI